MNQLNEQRASYEKNLDNSAWDKTPEDEKQKIRAAFESMEDERNTISHEKMVAHLNPWKERSGSRKHLDNSI